MTQKKRRTLTDEERARTETLITDLTRPIWVWRNARALVQGSEYRGIEPVKSRQAVVRGAPKRRDNALTEVFELLEEWFMDTHEDWYA